MIAFITMVSVPKTIVSAIGNHDGISRSSVFVCYCDPPHYTPSYIRGLQVFPPIPQQTLPLYHLLGERLAFGVGVQARERPGEQRPLFLMRGWAAMAEEGPTVQGRYASFLKISLLSLDCEQRKSLAGIHPFPARQVGHTQSQSGEPGKGVRRASQNTQDRVEFAGFTPICEARHGPLVDH